VKAVAASRAVLCLGLLVAPSAGHAAPAPAASPSETTTATVAAAPETGDGLAQQVGGWVVFGLGGASFVAGVVTGALALQTSSVLDQQCVNGQCAPPEHPQVDAFYALRTASTACLVASGPVLLGGIAMLLTVPTDAAADAGNGAEAEATAPVPARHAKARGASIGLTIGPGTIALGGAW
jgi:hypothetical protein